MYRKNVAGQFICVQLVLAASGAPATGLSPSGRRCLDGTFGAVGGSFTEDTGTGTYKLALAQADTNANNVSIIVTATGAIPVVVNFVTTAVDPTSANFGMANVSANLVQVNGHSVTDTASGILDVNAKNINNATAATPLTAAQIATGVWQDSTAGDFTAADSIGKSVMNGVALGTGLTVNAVTTAITLPTMPDNWITAVGIAASALNGKGDWNVGKTGYELVTGYDPAKTAAQAGDAMALTANERNSVADALLDRNMATGADSGSPTVRTPRQALRFLRNKISVAADTLTVTKEDDTTASWTATVTTDANALPIVSSDPAS